MENFTPVPVVEKKKKKINKFLVFGNLFLVILVALIGVLYYNKTLISTQKKAFECTGGYADKKKCAAEKREYEDSGRKAADREAKRKEEQEERRAEREETTASGSCPGGYENTGVEDSRGNIRHICCNMSSNKACFQQAMDLGIDVKVGVGNVGSGGFRCIIGQNNYSGGPCTGLNSVQSVGTGKPPACFCGTIQVDGGQWDGTYQSTCGCNKQETQAINESPPGGTIIPTPTDSVTNTPTPTATPIINSPTPTPTGVQSGTPTPTPTGTIVPTATPTPTGTPGPTNTPGGPTATPTEIIIANVSPTVGLLQTGSVGSFLYMIPALIILVGLIL